jgi:hypothetical protein
VLANCLKPPPVNRTDPQANGDRLAYTELRLVVAKLLWHFDLEIDEPHSGWFESGRNWVSFASGVSDWSNVKSNMARA